MYLRETQYEGVAWIQVAQDRFQWRSFVKMVMNLQIPKKQEFVIT
jgi:hypothetical protein